MTNNNDTAALSLLTNEAGYDPIEDRLRENIHTITAGKMKEYRPLRVQTKRTNTKWGHPQDL
jgi:hypothetical protein